MASAPSAERRRDRRDALLLSCLTLAIFSVRVFFGVPYSVGIVGAFRILDGDVPYRDFWTIYAPGQFYVLAGLFLVFGKHLVVASAARAVCIAAIGSEIFLIARTLETTRRIAAAVAGLFLLTMWALPPFGLGSYEPSLLFILMAWLVLARRGSVPNARAALAGGAAVGSPPGSSTTSRSTPAWQSSWVASSNMLAPLDKLGGETPSGTAHSSVPERPRWSCPSRLGVGWSRARRLAGSHSLCHHRLSEAGRKYDFQACCPTPR